MALEWEMIDELLDDEEEVEAWLQRGYEPFAVVNTGNPQAGSTSLKVFFKKQVNVERDGKATEVAGPLRGDLDEED